jgi:hypothetical protein
LTCSSAIKKGNPISDKQIAVTLMCSVRFIAGQFAEIEYYCQRSATGELAVFAFSEASDWLSAQVL